MARYEASKTKNFINPYNFVPVDLKHTRRMDATKREGELLTGYLECLVECKTHLAIPDMDNRKKDDKVSVNHFQYPFLGMKQGIPRIPGSSLRGVVRNIYETMTDSCFGTMERDTFVTTRRGQSFQPGLLMKEGNEWKLYKAVRHLIKDSTGNLMQQSGDKVYFKVMNHTGNNSGRERSFVKSFDFQPMEGGKVGYLCIGEKAPRRTYQSIFSKGDPVNNYPQIGQKDFQKLEAVLDVYRDKSINKNYMKSHKGYFNYEKMKKNGVIPVYYKVMERGQQKNILYLSFAALGRRAFENTLDGMLYEKSHQKCNGRKNLCPACALFGTVEGEGMGSRVRFTDATCDSFDEKPQLKREVVFGELSSPKISYTPFYLRAHEENANYREDYDSKDLEIRGRKFYWHHKPILRPENPIQKTERNATFDVVVPGTQFRFKVYFDGITREELSLLEAAIHLNENDIEGKLCQKIGHGKPLGYGSVKMCIEQCSVRIFDTMDGWREKKENISCDKEMYTCSLETWEALKRISNLEAYTDSEQEVVEYPSITTDRLSAYDKNNLKENDNSIASHQWFTQNYKLGAQRPNYVLPEIKENCKLPKYDILPYNKNNNQGKRGGKKW